MEVCGRPLHCDLELSFLPLNCPFAALSLSFHSRSRSATTQSRRPRTCSTRPTAISSTMQSWSRPLSPSSAAPCSGRLRSGCRPPTSTPTTLPSAEFASRLLSRTGEQSRLPAGGGEAVAAAAARRWRRPSRRRCWRHFSMAFLWMGRLAFLPGSLAKAASRRAKVSPHFFDCSITAASHRIIHLGTFSSACIALL